MAARELLALLALQASTPGLGLKAAWPAFGQPAESLPRARQRVLDFLAKAKECPSPFHTPLPHFNETYEFYEQLVDCWTPRPVGFQADVFEPDKVPIQHVPEDVQGLESLKLNQKWLHVDRSDGFIELPGGSTCGEAKQLAHGVAQLLRAEAPMPLDQVHMLDTGCGVASLDAELSQHYGVNTLGVAPMDEHKSQTFVTSQRGLPLFVIRMNKYWRFPAPSSRFDLVYCCWCRQHYIEYIREAHRLLKPGGLLVIDVYHSDGSNGYFSRSDFEKSCMTYVGEIKKGKFTKMAAPRVVFRERAEEGAGANATAREALAEQAFIEGKGIMEVYKKQNTPECLARHARQSELCTPQQLASRFHSPCLSGAPVPALAADAGGRQAWASLVQSMAGLGVFRAPAGAKVVSLLSANAADDAFTSAMRERSLDLWGLPRGAVHITNIASMRDTGNPLPGLVYQEFCKDNFRNHPRAYNLVFLSSAVSLVRECRGTPEVGGMPFAAHLLLEAYRVLRPGGHLVVSSSLADGAELEALFDVGKGQRLSSLGCLTEGSQRACVLRAA